LRSCLPPTTDGSSPRLIASAINTSKVAVMNASSNESRSGTSAAIGEFSSSRAVREYGIRVLLVEPAYTRTSFDTNAIPADEPLPLYAQRRETLETLETIVAAATDNRPKLRYPAGNLARRVSKVRR
jgi:NAD(P)-dependent dehydrogenase (short-subunit alcohol dehydrogenase family)